MIVFNKTSNDTVKRAIHVRTTTRGGRKVIKKVSRINKDFLRALGFKI